MFFIGVTALISSYLISLQAFAPAMQKRVGIYCLDADHGARLHAAVTEAVLTLICEKARALPPPSKLTHRAKLVYNEEWAR